jgi:hypothetical protein
MVDVEDGHERFGGGVGGSTGGWKSRSRAER